MYEFLSRISTSCCLALDIVLSRLGRRVVWARTTRRLFSCNIFAENLDVLVIVVEG